MEDQQLFSTWPERIALALIAGVFLLMDTVVLISSFGMEWLYAIKGIIFGWIRLSTLFGGGIVLLVSTPCIIEGWKNRRSRKSRG